MNNLRKYNTILSNKFQRCISCAEFRDHAPLIVIDCSKECETVKADAIDVRLEF